MPKRGGRNGKRDTQEEPYVFWVEKHATKKVGSNLHFGHEKTRYVTNTDEKFQHPPAAHENYQADYKNKGMNLQQVHFKLGDDKPTYTVSGKMRDHTLAGHEPAKPVKDTTQRVHISFGRDKVEYEPTTKRFYQRQPGDFKPLRIHSNSLAKTHIVLGDDDKREMKTNNQYTMVAHPVLPSREILKRDEDLRASHVSLGNASNEYTTSNKAPDHTKVMNFEKFKPREDPRTSHVQLGDGKIDYKTVYKQDIGNSNFEGGEGARGDSGGRVAKDNSTNIVLGSDAQKHYEASSEHFFSHPPSTAYDAQKGQGADVRSSHVVLGDGEIDYRTSSADASLSVSAMTGATKVIQEDTRKSNINLGTHAVLYESQFSHDFTRNPSEFKAYEAAAGQNVRGSNVCIGEDEVVEQYRTDYKRQFIEHGYAKSESAGGDARKSNINLGSSGGDYSTTNTMADYTREAQKYKPAGSEASSVVRTSSIRFGDHEVEYKTVEQGSYKPYIAKWAKK